MDDKPTDIKTLVDKAGKPKQPGKPTARLETGKPKAQADRANVVNLKEETALRSAFERKIEETEDKTKLVYGVGLDVHKSALRKSSKEALFKLIAKKAAVSLEILKADLIDAGGEPQGRGRANAGFLPYEIKGNQLWVIDDQGPRPLCNFTANIAEEIIHDDGLNEEVLFCIEGRLHDGTDFPRVEVSASKFASLSWVTSEWGARPLIHAGNSIKRPLAHGDTGACALRETAQGVRSHWPGARWATSGFSCTAAGGLGRMATRPTSRLKSVKATCGTTVLRMKAAATCARMCGRVCACWTFPHQTGPWGLSLWLTVTAHPWARPH